MELINDCYICHVMWNANNGEGTTKTFKALIHIWDSREMCKSCSQAVERLKNYE